MTPTQLSLRHLRAEGWTVDVVERWVPSGGPGGGVRKDFLGCIDLIALRGHETLGVQTTVAGSVSSRLHKMSDDEHAPALAAMSAAGWTVVIHGWRLSTQKGNHACPHGRPHCGCRWTLHRLIDLSTEVAS